MAEDYILNDHNKDEFPPSHTAEHLLNQTMIRIFGCLSLSSSSPAMSCQTMSVSTVCPMMLPIPSVWSVSATMMSVPASASTSEAPHR